MTDKKLISSLQGLRAVAFLCVVISHCGAPWLGPWAISVFVALSGFLMVCNYYDRPRTAPGLQSAIAFSFKKIRRLYPLHLIMMAAALLFVLKGLLAQPSARGVLSCAAQLAVSIFLLQTWIPSSRFWFCLNGVAWYLSVQAFLYAIFPTLLAVLKKADARKLRCILPDLSVSAVPGRRFYHQLLRGLSLPQPQTGEHTTAQCFLPIRTGRCTACGRLPFHCCQAGGGSGRSGLPVQCAVHSLCGAAGLAARHGQRVHFPAAIRKAVFVAGTALPLRLSDPSGTDPVYGVDCGQV